MDSDVPPRHTFPPSHPHISQVSWDDFVAEYRDDQEEQRDNMETMMQYQRAQNEWFVTQYPDSYIPPSAAFHQTMTDRALARQGRRLDRSSRCSGDDGAGPSGS